VAAVVASASLGLGLVAGVVWEAVAPRPGVVARDDTAIVDPLTTAAFFGSAAWFVVVAAVTGVLLAAAAWWPTRDDGVGALVGLAVGGLLGAVVAWRVGQWLGPDPVSAVPPPGARVDGPLRLDAYGALFAWPIAAVTTYFALTVGFARASAVPPADATSEETSAATSEVDGEPSAWASDGRGGGIGQTHEVGGRELDVEAPAPPGHEHRLMGERGGVDDGR
jgi:hypothetical protein